MRYNAHSCAHWLGIWCIIPLYKSVNRYPILISTIEMNPEIYHERSNESPKQHKRVQQTPEADQGVRVKSYRRSSPEMDLKIQSQTESADGRAEREFYSRGVSG